MNQRKQSSTTHPMTFLMIDSADHLSGKTGLTVTVTLSKDGASFAAAAGAVTETGSGWYALAGNATDRGTLGELTLHATATGADPTDKAYVIVPWDPFDANLALTGLTGLTAPTAGKLPTSGTGADQISLSSGKVAEVALCDALTTNNDKAGYALTAAYDAAKTAATQTSVNTVNSNVLSSASILNGVATDYMRRTDTVTASSVTDKAGYSLTAAYDAAKTAAQAGDAMKVSVGTGAGQVDVAGGKVPATLAAADVAGNLPSVLADGVAHGGTPGASTATFAMKQMNLYNPNDVALSVQSPAGDAILIVSATNGITVAAGTAGTGHVLNLTTSSGDGIHIEVVDGRGLSILTSRSEAYEYPCHAIQAVASGVTPPTIICGLDVFADGSTVHQVQKFGVNYAGGGTFTLTFDDTGSNPQTTAAIAFDATAAAVDAALQALSNLTAVDVARSVDPGDPDVLVYRVTFLDSFDNYPPLTADASGLVGLPNSAVRLGGLAGGLARIVGDLAGTVDGLSAAGLATLFAVDSTKTYADAVTGSVVKEIATNAGGGGADPDVALSGTLGSQGAGSVDAIVLPSGPAGNGVLAGSRLRITSGAAQYQERTIATWDGTGKIAGIDETFAGGTPASGDTFEVRYDHSHQIASGSVLAVGQVSSFQAGALAQFFTVDSTKVYADAVPGSVVKEMTASYTAPDNAGILAAIATRQATLAAVEHGESFEDAFSLMFSTVISGKTTGPAAGQAGTFIVTEGVTQRVSAPVTADGYRTTAPTITAP